MPSGPCCPPIGKPSKKTRACPRRRIRTRTPDVRGGRGEDRQASSTKPISCRSPAGTELAGRGEGMGPDVAVAGACFDDLHLRPPRIADAALDLLQRLFSPLLIVNDADRDSKTVLLTIRAGSIPLGDPRAAPVKKARCSSGLSISRCERKCPQDPTCPLDVPRPRKSRGGPRAMHGRQFVPRAAGRQYATPRGGDRRTAATRFARVSDQAGRRQRTAAAARRNVCRCAFRGSRPAGEAPGGSTRTTQRPPRDGDDLDRSPATAAVAGSP